MLRFCFIFLLIKFSVCDEPRPQLRLPTGKVRGTYQQSLNGTWYAAFEGIPYATPPLGQYRFREPHPMKPWKGVWEANYFHTCLQYNHYANLKSDPVIGNEDCLYLNVYSPKLNRAAMLDVIVYIHGGAFMFGEGYSNSPATIMNRNIVYVNFNYRVGILGFLSTEDTVVPGNMGMKDQVLALQWVKKNIHLFGGNPNSITLVGTSAGGASVHLHYMSPMSKGLFNQGFSMSGTALNPWVLAEKSLDKAKQIGASMGCGTTSTADMIECLRSRPGRQLVHSIEPLFGFLYNPFSPLGVVVEPEGTQDPFLSEHPYKLLKTGLVQNVPWITSSVKAEGLFPTSEFYSEQKYMDDVSARWNEVAPDILDYNYTVVHNETRTYIAQQAKAYYLHDKPISKDTFNELVQLIGDRLFVSGSQNAAKLHAAISTSPVYYYYFTYRGAHSGSEILSKSTENFGVGHGDDTNYVLSNGKAMRTTDRDVKMSEMLLDMWISYTKTGVPTLHNESWRAVSKKPEDPLNFVEIASVDSSFERTSQDFGHSSFWQGLPIQENEHLTELTSDEF